MAKGRRIVFDIGELRLRVECSKCPTEVLIAPGHYPPEVCPNTLCTAKWITDPDARAFTYREVMNLLKEVELATGKAEGPEVNIRFEVRA